ncbi:TolC family protein [Methylobacterium sp. C25]|uniref:TolC family protein n=1 Tax=Methylobacterium sp. C25 TaxID=2721622 RepID=UPI001F3CECBF|nr:TolC family protein [Methylobacterium sp. C25]MCE4224899.1 TolC family protein [Methylobacterium sp. C25]
MVLDRHSGGRRTRRVLSVLLGATTLAAALAGCTLKPEPLGQAELGAYAADKLRRVGSDQPLPGPRIDLYEAFARALKYNLDQRVEIMQTAVRAQELSFASYSMLPNFVANSAYAGRDSYAASSSISVLTQRQSLEPSYSQDKNYVFSDLSLSWNILDFGLSYIRARQAADTVLIAEENRRRVVSRIIEDVRTAYWRALSSERLASRLRQLEGRAQAAIGNARQLYKDRQTSPITALTYERELIEIKREIQRVETDLLVARSQLAALMNLPPDLPFRLAEMEGVDAGLKLGVADPDLVRVALENRSELREVAYRQRINGREATAALLELLPGMNLIVGGNADSNRLLYNSNWVGWGARASWNLMNVFKYPARQGLIDAQDALLDKRALAVTMAVMTQVHVSRVRHMLAMKEFQTASEFRRVQRRIVEQMRASAAVESASEQTLIREEMNTLIAEVKYDLAHAAVQNARANVYASLGLDTFPLAVIDRYDLPQLKRAVQQSWLGIGAVFAEAPPIPRVPAGPAPLVLRH